MQPKDSSLPIRTQVTLKLGEGTFILTEDSRTQENRISQVHLLPILWSLPYHNKREGDFLGLTSEQGEGFQIQLLLFLSPYPLKYTHLWRYLRSVVCCTVHLSFLLIFPNQLMFVTCAAHLKSFLGSVCSVQNQSPALLFPAAAFQRHSSIGLKCWCLPFLGHSCGNGNGKGTAVILFMLFISSTLP